MDRHPPDISPTVLHRFLEVVRRVPDSPMIEEWPGDGQVPSVVAYRDVFREVEWRAQEIGRRVSPLTPCVGLSSPPGRDWILSYLALLLANRIPVLIDHLQPEPAVREVLERFDVTTLLSSGLSMPDLEMPNGCRRLEFTPAPPLFLSPEELDRRIAALEGTLARDSDRVAHLMLTSGTTGTPKGIPLTHDNLLFDCDRILEKGIYREGDRVLCVLPLHHSYPFMVNFLLPLSVGGAILFPPDLSPAALRDILARGKVGLFPAVPALWEGFHRRIMEEIAKKPRFFRVIVQRILLPVSFFLRERSGIDIGRYLFRPVRQKFGQHLKVLSSGGAALRVDVARDFFAMGLTMLEGYGLTETSPVISMNTPQEWRIGSVGRPLAGVEIRVDPPAEGAPGGLVRVRGRNVAAFFWEGPEERAPLCDGDGWFETGDLGVNDEGFLRLVGREKDMIVLPNGKKIFPDVLERRLAACEGVADAAVLMEKTALVALMRPEDALDPLTRPEGPDGRLFRALESLNREVAAHSRIAAFEEVSEPLPRTRLGKLRRFLLPELYREHRKNRLDRLHAKGAGLSTGGGDPFVEQVREMIREVAGPALLPGDEVSDSLNLESDLSIDSLGRIDLLERLEEALGHPIPDRMFSGVVTVGDLIRRLVEEGMGTTPEDTLWNRPLDPVEEAHIPERGKSGGSVPTVWQRLLYHGMRGIGRVVFGIRWPRFEEGSLPPGPFILVANHTSYLDGLVLALCLPPLVLSRTLFWGWAPIFDGPLRPFRNLFGIVSIDPSQALSGLRIAIYLLRSGCSLGIFPEGERSRDGSLGKFRPGVGLLVEKCRVPVVPVGLSGVFEAYPPHRRFPVPGRISICIGPSIESGSLEGLSHGEIARRLEEALRDLTHR